MNRWRWLDDEKRSNGRPTMNNAFTWVFLCVLKWQGIVAALWDSLADAVYVSTKDVGGAKDSSLLIEITSRKVVLKLSAKGIHCCGYCSSLRADSDQQKVHLHRFLKIIFLSSSKGVLTLNVWSVSLSTLKSQNLLLLCVFSLLSVDKSTCGFQNPPKCLSVLFFWSSGDKRLMSQTGALLGHPPWN